MAYLTRHAARRPAVPGGMGRLLVSCAVAVVLAALFGLPGVASEGADRALTPVLSIRHGPAELAACDPSNAIADSRGLVVGSRAGFRPSALCRVGQRQTRTPGAGRRDGRPGSYDGPRHLRV